MAPDAPLHGIRVLECSALGPAAITMPLVDLGAEVIKVEPPAGDYIREMTWPIVEGVSLMHLHVNRGKRSIVMDLRQPEDVATFKELAKVSDVVVEAMRPGGLARRGVGYEDLRLLNPRLVFCTISGYGMTGPYRDLAVARHRLRHLGGDRLACGGLGGVRVFAGARLDGDPRRAVVRRAWGSSPRCCGRSGPVQGPSWRSPSPTRPPPWTGTGPRPGVRTSVLRRK